MEFSAQCASRRSWDSKLRTAHVEAEVFSRPCARPRLNRFGEVVVGKPGLDLDRIPEVFGVAKCVLQWVEVPNEYFNRNLAFGPQAFAALGERLTAVTALSSDPRSAARNLSTDVRNAAEALRTRSIAERRPVKSQNASSVEGTVRGPTWCKLKHRQLGCPFLSKGTSLLEV